MPPRTAALLALLLAAPLPSLAQKKPLPLPPMTADQWRADVDYLARELPKRHKNAFHTVTREQFEAAAAALRAKAGAAGDDEMLVALMQTASMVGDGHTYVHLPSGIHQFPLAIARIEGAHRVVRGAGAAAELVGGKLVRIDDMPLDAAIARVHTILPQAESDVLMNAFTPQWLVISEVLHGLGVTKSAATARYTAVLDGTERTAEVSAIDASAKPEWKTAAANPPLYRQRPTDNFWFEWLPDAQTVYVNWRRYDDLRKNSRELWDFVDSHPVKKIAIDLRQNGGGDYHVGRKYMVDELARRPKLRGYVITGGRTFSAALKNSIDFRQIAHATLVGETIGERPNSYSENDELRLPNSRLEVSYSTRYYTFLPGDEGLVVPDKEIEQTWAEWVAGKDPVMEWVVGQ